MRNEDAQLHALWARQAEQRGDFLAARLEHLKCVESWKQSGDGAAVNAAKAEYSAFVRRDPIFKALVAVLVRMIQENPGILQSDISKSAESSSWPALYNYNRPLSREDISYALYFAHEFGIIARTKKGRSYELRLASHSL